jgi:hypothetical protein
MSSGTVMVAAMFGGIVKVVYVLESVSVNS